MLASCSATASRSGWAKIVQMAAATISAEPLGTRASTLRMKCTRQRCHPAPTITAPIAPLRPSWASEITSLTPPRPRARSERRKAVQKAPVLGVADGQPEHLAAAVGARTLVAITTALLTTSGPSWALT